MIVSPMTLVREGIEAVPAVKYALGVGAIAAIVAIVAGFQIDMRIALFGTVAVIALMFLLLVFVRAATQEPAWLELPAKVATWSFILLIIGGAALVTTSYFFAWPNALGDPPAGAARQQPDPATTTAPQNPQPQATTTAPQPARTEPETPVIDEPRPIVASTGNATQSQVQSQCDTGYRLAMQEQLRRLIEAEIGRCTSWSGDQIELHYSCSFREDFYRIRLVRQYRGELNGEVLRFQAEYSGPRELDVSRLRIRPLTPDYRRLCAEARRRRGS